MFEARVDKARNLLAVSYSENVGQEEARRCEEQLRQLLPELQPGFQVLADLTRLEAMDTACVPHIRRIMDLCDQKGVNAVVRVIPDPRKDIGFNILSLFHYRRHVPIVTCQTLEEARKMLSGEA
ncbi:MAG: hypothetical protein DME25_03400 [Verrucomicrobia bacterium]|nr:MAG: hypothetical protein DME25_03400 [Verrucomicrobiota bacterium]